MRAGLSQTKPVGFNVLTRIVYVHLVFSLVVLTSALLHAFELGSHVAAASVGAGLVIAVAIGFAMFGVAKQRSLRALSLLRLLSWMAVVRASLGLFAHWGASDLAAVEPVRSILLNEAFLIPLAIYWSRPVHARYLAALEHSS